MGEFLRRIRYLIHQRRIDAELESDMEFHREMAARAGRNNFGNTLRMREKAREAWGWTWLDRLAQDVRYGIRILARAARIHADGGAGAGDWNRRKCLGVQPVQHGRAQAASGAQSGSNRAPGAALAQCVYQRDGLSIVRILPGSHEKPVGGDGCAGCASHAVR